MTVTIHHNPDCGTSRNVLGLIRNSGEEPRIVEYLKTPFGVRLCRPSKTAIDILPDPQRGALAKEDGAPVADERGRRVVKGVAA